MSRFLFGNRLRTRMSEEDAMIRVRGLFCGTGFLLTSVMLIGWLNSSAIKHRKIAMRDSWISEGLLPDEAWDKVKDRPSRGI